MSSDMTWIKLMPSFWHPYIFTSEYCYIDSEEYELDKILWDTDIGVVKYNKIEGVHPDYPGFKICFVKCLKGKCDEMEQALRKLDWVLTVKYGTKYNDMKNNVMDKLIDGYISYDN